MDGLTKETYEKVRVKGNFEEVLGNIERFLELKHELGSSVEADIQIVRLSETDAEVAAFVERWRNSRADMINIKELDTWGDQIDDVSALTVDEDAVEDVPRSIQTASRARTCGTTATSTGTASSSPALATMTRLRHLATSRTAACSRSGTAHACG